MFEEYRGVNGAVYKVNKDRIARGGEGSIHEIQNMHEYVAKIFKKNKRDSEREEKICKMSASKFSNKTSEYTTWPLDVLYDEYGFAGYVMRRAQYNNSLSELYSNSKYDLKVRLYAAYNLCAAIEEIHNMGQVCGDLNPRNICINLNEHDKDVYKVTLVDTDSYHFITDKKIYRCEVGLAEYLAPEIQKKVCGEVTLKNAPLPTFTKETDLFALAVHVFCLLMGGSHPFACAKRANGQLSNTMEQMAGEEIGESVVAPQPIENIKNGFFPFYIRKANIDIPVYAPEFESLTPKLQELFVRTFVDGYKKPEKRVQAQEWLEALKPIIEKFESETVCCKNNHYYFKHLSYCPYCEVRQKILGAMEVIDRDDDTELVEVKDKSQKKHTVGWTICWWFLMISTMLGEPSYFPGFFHILDFGVYCHIPISNDGNHITVSITIFRLAALIALIFIFKWRKRQ